MFNFRTFIAAAAAVTTLATAAAADTAALRVQNNSGETIYRIYASPVTNSSWENDLLGSNVLTAGRFLDVTIRNFAVCEYDILIQFESGYEFTDVIDLCRYNTYTVN
jgi:hypothetical protein